MIDPRLIFGAAVLVEAAGHFLDSVTEAFNSRRARKVAKHACQRNDWHSIYALDVAHFSMGEIKAPSDEEETEEEESDEDEDEPEADRVPCYRCQGAGVEHDLMLNKTVQCDECNGTGYDDE